MGGTSFREYGRLMFFHRQFRYLFASFVVTNAGNWLTYIASLRLIEKYARPSRASLFVALFMVCRLAPGVLCAPVAGVLADRVDRRIGMAACELVAALLVLVNLLVRSATMLPLLFAAAFAQNVCAACYDPMRRALVPDVVEPTFLKAASTLDASVRRRFSLRRAL